MLLAPKALLSPPSSVEPNVEVPLTSSALRGDVVPMPTKPDDAPATKSEPKLKSPSTWMNGVPRCRNAPVALVSPSTSRWNAGAALRTPTRPFEPTIRTISSSPDANTWSADGPSTRYVTWSLPTLIPRNATSLGKSGSGSCSTIVRDVMRSPRCSDPLGRVTPPMPTKPFRSTTSVSLSTVKSASGREPALPWILKTSTCATVAKYAKVESIATRVTTRRNVVNGMARVTGDRRVYQRPAGYTDVACAAVSDGTLSRCHVLPSGEPSSWKSSGTLLRLVDMTKKREAYTGVDTPNCSHSPATPDCVPCAALQSTGTYVVGPGCTGAPVPRS